MAARASCASSAGTKDKDKREGGRDGVWDKEGQGFNDRGQGTRRRKGRQDEGKEGRKKGEEAEPEEADARKGRRGRAEEKEREERERKVAHTSSLSHQVRKKRKITNKIKNLRRV